MISWFYIPTPQQEISTFLSTGQDEMKEISILDINLVRTYKGLSTKQFAIVQEGLPDGMYIGTTKLPAIP